MSGPQSVLRLIARRFGLKELPIALPARPWPVAIVTLKHRTLSPVVQRPHRHVSCHECASFSTLNLCSA
jgi:hypothetical protein